MMDGLTATFLAVLDGGGVYGHFYASSFLFALFGSAFLIFVYLWRKGRLDMDEEPKFQMLEDEEEGERHGS